MRMLSQFDIAWLARRLLLFAIRGVLGVVSFIVLAKPVLGHSSIEADSPVTGEPAAIVDSRPIERRRAVGVP